MNSLRFSKCGAILSLGLALSGIQFWVAGMKFFMLCRDEHQAEEASLSTEAGRLLCLHQMGILILGGVVFLVVVLAITFLEWQKMKYRAEHPLPGLIAMCSWCNTIRDGKDWVRADLYLQKHLGTRFTHSLCPKCMNTETEKLTTSTRRS